MSREVFDFVGNSAKYNAFEVDHSVPSIVESGCFILFRTEVESERVQLAKLGQHSHQVRLTEQNPFVVYKLCTYL